eukprot:3287936-Pyramimonas_sp.AAC.1
MPTAGADAILPPLQWERTGGSGARLRGQKFCWTRCGPPWVLQTCASMERRPPAACGGSQRRRAGRIRVVAEFRLNIGGGGGGRGRRGGGG